MYIYTYTCTGLLFRRRTASGAVGDGDVVESGLSGRASCITIGIIISSSSCCLIMIVTIDCY